MARHQDGQPIIAVGAANRPLAGRNASSDRQSFITACFPKRDFQQESPDPLLKIGSRRPQGDIEALATAGEVLSKLLMDLLDELVVTR